MQKNLVVSKKSITFAADLKRERDFFSTFWLFLHISLSLFKGLIMEKTNIVKAIVYLVAAIAGTIAIAFGLPSCNVTRIVTTEAQHITRGDTTTTILTKTTETYDAKKH